LKPAPFAFHAPDDLPSCLALLAEHGDEAAVLAGGQGLMTLMRLRLARPEQVVSIRRIGGELAEVRADGNAVHVGASVTMAAAAKSAHAHDAFPGLREAIRHVATPPVRARATVCGNLAHADPASELPALAAALDARVHLASSAGARTVGIEDFLDGPYMTARRDDELITALEFPATVAKTDVFVREVGRVQGGFAIAGIVVTRTNDGAGPGYGVACFGLGPTALRVRGAERALAEVGTSDEGIGAAADELDAAVSPHSDFYATAAYRRSAARTLLRRALLDARGAAARSSGAL
jgi:carbon-monoxide dehydrogenase medium subunit